MAALGKSELLVWVDSRQIALIAACPLKSSQQPFGWHRKKILPRRFQSIFPGCPLKARKQPGVERNMDRLNERNTVIAVCGQISASLGGCITSPAFLPIA